MDRPTHLSQVQDTTTRIWDWLYRVRVPYLQSRTIEDIRMHGVVITGIEEFDRDIQNQWMTTMMPIADMVTYYRESVPIKVCDPRDVREIYDAITMHLQAWIQRLQIGINIHDAPIEDLITMDRFANTVYDEAKYQFTPEIADSLIIRQMQSVQRINPQNIFAPTKINHLRQGDQDPYPARDGMGDFFKSRLTYLRS
jgi:hypothetical protein